MLQKLVEIEQNRLKTLDYESIVTPVSVYVSDTLQIETIGNDTYILTGIRISNDDILNDLHELTVVSPTESIQLSQQEIATLGTSVLKTFKEFIIIKTTDENEFSTDSEITPFRMDFIKISPVL
jgi:hypothetical protein